MSVYLIATVQSKPEYTIEVLQVLQHMVAETQEEAACIEYHLHRDLEDENRFIFYEIWESEAGLKLHNEQPYIRAFAAMAGEKLEGRPVVRLLQRLSPYQD